MSIPCKDCVTFAMCKNRVLENNKLDKFSYMRNITVEMLKCYKLCDFITNGKPYDEESYRRAEKILNFFRGEYITPSEEKVSKKSLLEFFKQISFSILVEGVRDRGKKIKETKKKNL